MICNEQINACNAIMNFGYIYGHSNHLPGLNHVCKIECLHTYPRPKLLVCSGESTFTIKLDFTVPIVMCKTFTPIVEIWKMFILKWNPLFFSLPHRRHSSSTQWPSNIRIYTYLQKTPTLLLRLSWSYHITNSIANSFHHPLVHESHWYSVNLHLKGC